jgi:hypothetical protein
MTYTTNPITILVQTPINFPGKEKRKEVTVCGMELDDPKTGLPRHLCGPDEPVHHFI